jgi:hypothetical protein
MKYVVIVNGKPESGKTTFERECRDYLDKTEYAFCHIKSSIDPIKEVYRKLGWNGEKTDTARKHLSELKKIWVDTCNGAVRHIVDYILKLNNDDNHVIFVDIREESEIIALSDILDALQVLDIKYYKMLIERPDIDGLEYGNKSDDMVGRNGSLYNVYVCNDGTLDDLRSAAHEFIEDLNNNNVVTTEA